MDDAFLDSEGVPRAELHALYARSDRPSLIRFGVQAGIFLTAAVVVALAPELGLPWGLSAIGVGVVALAVMGSFALMHEAAHGTAFASRRLNRVVTWLTAAPFYYTPSGFREFHFTHHRHTHEPTRDPEISIGGKPAPGVTQSLVVYLGFVTGLPILLFKVMLMLAASLGGPPAIWSGVLSFVAPRARARLRWEARAVLALHLLWVGAGVLWLPGLLHLLVAQLLGHMLLSWYLVAEHNGLPHEGDVLARTRTMHPGPLMRWLMWNMPYHAEHHAYPAVPWHALPRLHALMHPLVHNVGGRYFRFHLEVWRALLSRRR